MIQILNILFGGWAIVSAIVAAQSLTEFRFQTLLIFLFVFTEAIQGILLVLAPKPVVALRRTENIIAVFIVVILSLMAGVNVIESPLQNHLGVVLLLLGQLLSLWALISLNRGFGLFAEVRTICTKGPYQYMKHPMYIGYGLQYIGLAFQTMNVWSWICLLLAGITQVWRAYHENEALDNLRYSRKFPNVQSSGVKVEVR